jgi:hypothetical protein
MKLTKQERGEQTAHVSALQEAAAKLTRAVEDYNAAAATAWEKLIVPALEAYNNTLDEARAFAENIASNVESFYDEKSEKWQEGDRGSAVQDMQDEWISFDASEVEIDAPDELDEPDLGHAADLEGLPVEPQ